MIRRHLSIFFASLILSATVAEARLMNPQLPPPDESAHTAVHLPTGCIAKVVLSGTSLVKAEITDPLCLPNGVRARGVPGKLIDFTLTRD